MASTSTKTGVGTSVDTATEGNTGVGAPGPTGPAGPAGAAGAAGTPGTTNADSVNTTGAPLSALASAAFPAGTLCWVGTVLDFFLLVRPAVAPTVDNITCVAASGKAGYFWLRQLSPSPSYATVTIWSIDPVNGNDELTGTGASAAAADLVALKTLQELKRRLWGLEVEVAVTVRLIGNMVASDVGAWNTKWYASTFTIQGQLGPVTGSAGVVDNTLYTGSLTSPPVVPAATPSADDFEITDTAIPASYTASGLLAPGVLFQRTSGAARFWWGLKDLGTKTLRINNPASTATTFGTWNGAGLANGDVYKAFALYTYFSQDFGPDADRVVLSQVIDKTTSFVITEGPQTTRVWSAAAQPVFNVPNVGNTLMPMLEVGAGSKTLRLQRPDANSAIIGGAARANGGTNITLDGGILPLIGGFVSQGVQLAAFDRGCWAIEQIFAMHDLASACLLASGPQSMIAILCLTLNQGMSGMGNSGKLVITQNGGCFYYGGNSALPPFSAASTSDGTPIQNGSVSYAVAQLPTVEETLVAPWLTFSPQQIDQFSLIGALLTSAIGATSTYMANPGTTLAVANVATQQRYPGGKRWMTGLRVTVRAGILTNDATVTLYKNGVATAMAATVTAGAAAGTQFSDFAHPVLFAEGDDYDLRMDDAADASAATLIVSAGLEAAA